jgi:hypothetical protein
MCIIALMSSQYKVEVTVKGLKKKLQVKLSHYHHAGDKLERRYCCNSFLTSALDGGEWSVSHTSGLYPTVTNYELTFLHKFCSLYKNMYSENVLRNGTLHIGFSTTTMFCLYRKF